MKKFLPLLGVSLVLTACGTANASQTKESTTTSSVSHVSSTTTAPPQTTSTTSPPPPSSTTTSTAPTTTTTTSPPNIVTFTVTGTGPANDITILNGSQESQHNDVSLPYSTTAANGQFDYGVTAQDGSGSASAVISCAIEVPGSAPVTQTSTGAYAVVTCSATPGF